MSRGSSILGLIGLVLLLFAAVAAFLTRAQTTVDIVYIAVNAGLGAFALITYLSTGLDHLRTMLSERSTKYGASTIFGSIVFLAILVIVNYIAAQNPKRFDVTEQGIYSLSPQSISVVQNLKEDLDIVAFVEGGINPPLADLLKSYGYHSDKLKFRLVDPDREPQLAEQLQIRTYNTVQLTYGKESTKITEPTEENITNALIKVTRGTKKMLCFIEGHGEPDSDDAEARGLASLKQALIDENYEVKKVLLASMATVPEDCSVVALIGPQRPMLENELQALGDYLKIRNGGRLLVALSPRRSDELKPLLATWGVEVGDNVIVDQVIRLFQGPALGLAPLVRDYGAHEITKDLKQMTVFPMSRSVKAAASGTAGLTAIELAKSSESSWAETDLAGLFERSEAALDEAVDTKGPVAVAVVVEADLKQMGSEGAARLAVYGSSDFATNRELEGTYYNRDLLLNTFGWLAGQTDLLSIRTKTVRASRASFTQEQGTVIFYLSVLVIPQILLLAGLVVWWRRE